MRVPGSLPAFALGMALAVLLAVAGVAAIAKPSGSSLIGLLLLLLAGSVRHAARNGRAAYLHRQYLKNSWRWAQGLGPNKRQERGRL